MPPGLCPSSGARRATGEGAGRWGFAGQTVGRNLGMIRAIIGTVAVLAGFVVVENSVDASTGLSGSCKATQAYALLRPGEQLPIRAVPTPDGKVVGELSTQNMTADRSPAGEFSPTGELSPTGQLIASAVTIV